MDPVHVTAGLGFAQDCYFDLPERDRMADEFGQVYSFDENVRTSCVPGQVDAQFSADLVPMLPLDEGNAAPLASLQVPFESSVGMRDG
jgi:hypothetical protein